MQSNGTGFSPSVAAFPARAGLGVINASPLFQFCRLLKYQGLCALISIWFKIETKSC